MTRTKIHMAKAESIPSGLALGAGVSLVLTIALAALIVKLVQTETLQQNQIGYAVMVLLLISSFLGATIARGRVNNRRAMVCMLSGMIYFLILVSITALFFGGQYEGFGATALVVLGGAGTAALLSAGRAGKGAGRRKAYRR